MTRYPIYHKGYETGAVYLPDNIRVDKDKAFSIKIDEQTVVKKNNHEEKVSSLSEISFWFPLDKSLDK